MALLDDLIEKRVALVAALSSGTSEVQFGEDRVKYRTTKEIAAAIRFLDGEIASHGRRSSVFYLNPQKGV